MKFNEPIYSVAMDSEGEYAYQLFRFDGEVLEVCELSLKEAMDAVGVLADAMLMPAVLSDRAASVYEKMPERFEKVG